jgi:hypothetical protein
MRYVVAIVACAVAIITMFACAYWIRRYGRQWRDEDGMVCVSPKVAIGISLGYFVLRYWYAIIPVLLALAIGIASVWPKSATAP